MNTKHLAWAVFLAGGLGVAHASAVCPIKTIHNHGPFIKFGRFKGHLISPDDPNNSRAWEGPLVITQPSGTTCSVRTGIFDASFFQAGSHFLYATVYSGAEANQLLIDARTCKVPWISPQFVGDPVLGENDVFHYREAPSVKIGANCRPAPEPKRAD